MDTPVHLLSKQELESMITEFEREYQLWTGFHTAAELADMDPVHLERLRKLYADAIDICMIERRRHTEGEENS